MCRPARYPVHVNWYPQLMGYLAFNSYINNIQFPTAARAKLLMKSSLRGYNLTISSQPWSTTCTEHSAELTRKQTANMTLVDGDSQEWICWVSVQHCGNTLATLCNTRLDTYLFRPTGDTKKRKQGAIIACTQQQLV